MGRFHHLTEMRHMSEFVIYTYTSRVGQATCEVVPSFFNNNNNNNSTSSLSNEQLLKTEKEDMSSLAVGSGNESPDAQPGASPQPVRHVEESEPLSEVENEELLPVAPLQFDDEGMEMVPGSGGSGCVSSDVVEPGLFPPLDKDYVSFQEGGEEKVGWVEGVVHHTREDSQEPGSPPFSPLRPQSSPMVQRSSSSSSVEEQPQLSMRRRANLVFSVRRVKAHLENELARDYPGEIIVEDEAAVYLSAVLEYMSAELLELSGNAARDNEKERITPPHLQLAVVHDPELRELLGNAPIPSSSSSSSSSPSSFSLSSLSSLLKERRKWVVLVTVSLVVAVAAVLIGR